MNIVNNTHLQLEASIYAFNQAVDEKNEEVLSALGMTPETQQAEKKVEETIKQSEIAQATGQGVNIDFKA